MHVNSLLEHSAVWGGKTVVTEQKDIQNIPHAARCRIDELKCYPYSW